MPNRNRDDFTDKTKLQLAKRAGWLCSDPSCRRSTIGSNAGGDGEINLGTAAHICAAAPEGPRYDAGMTPAQRKSPDNGIWMCSLHGRAVDARDSTFTVELLRTWKAQAQKESRQRVLYGDPTPGPPGRAYSSSELSDRFRSAAIADLDMFRRAAKWPSTAIDLTLRVEGIEDFVSPSAITSVLTKVDDLILVAPPGTGKTTTLFQIADAALASESASPIVIPLGAWSAEGGSLLEAVLRRPAFRTISEDELRSVAASPGVIMLLDGWNELDDTARKRAAAQIERLQIELPELGLLIATRRQALDVPVDGVRVEIQPLNEQQQLGIARALRGDEGAPILYRAWRTGGVSELVTIPLYLTVLLALPTNTPFPATKEEMLRRFVEAHETQSQSAAALAAVMHGLHQRFMEDLAATATHSGNTTLADADARRSISNTDEILLAEGQITEKAQPAAVLGTLVSHHLLVRGGEPAGYSFQHQQFQEWFASRRVERQMLAALDDHVTRQKLRAEIFDRAPWEEAILFACERLAAGPPRHIDACGAAILSTFAVDPMLAAEMIYRSNDAAWSRVGARIRELVSRWHAPGSVDRAVRFMIASGRPEFFDLVWPLITDEDDQVSVSALRAARYFRTSLLGCDAAARISALPLKVRKIVVHEIAFHGGADGLDIAAAIGKDAPEPEVKAVVIDALAFRRADRHIIDVLRQAGDYTFDLLARNDLFADVSDQEIDDGDVRQKLLAARARRQNAGISPYDRLRAIVYARDAVDRSDEVTELIAEIDLPTGNGPEVPLVFELRNRYLTAIASGILRRLRLGLDIFHDFGHLVAAANLNLEDSSLLEIALKTGSRDARANAAVSALGPRSVGRMIDALFEVKARIPSANGSRDAAAANRYFELLHRIAHAPGASLIGAIEICSPPADNETVASLAELIWRHPTDENHRGRPFNADTSANITALAQDWGDRLLASGTATRVQLASIAQLVAMSPTVALLPMLKRLLDEDLRQWRAFRRQALADRYCGGTATNEARTAWTLRYQNAFITIRDPATTALMTAYLPDQDFGQCAAIVLAEQWRAENDPSDNTRFRFGLDFSHVDDKRTAREAQPDATSPEAESIFSVIEALVTNEASDDQKKHAVALGIIGARLPHGERSATMQKLLTLAARGPRAALTQSLILSGEAVDVSVVKNGIAEVLEAAKTQTWILMQDGYQLKEWLRLLPFTSRPQETIAIVRDLPAPQREPRFLEEMFAAFAMAHSPEAEDVVFQLAEADPRLYGNHDWRAAALRRDSPSAANRFVDLVADGIFANGISDRWHLAREIGGLIGDWPELRAYVYQLLRSSPPSPGHQQLAQAVAENPDSNGLLLLVGLELQHGLSFVNWRTVEAVITNYIPAENWAGAYNIVPVSAAELRKNLLAMVPDGGVANAASSCLSLIDGIRDTTGAFQSDPRHPDIASGRPWPVIPLPPQETHTSATAS